MECVFFFNVLPHMFPVNDGGEMTDSQDKRGLKHAELQDKSSPLGNNDDDATWQQFLDDSSYSK